MSFQLIAQVSVLKNHDPEVSELLHQTFHNLARCGPWAESRAPVRPVRLGVRDVETVRSNCFMWGGS